MKYLFNAVKTENIVGTVEAASENEAAEIVNNYVRTGDAEGISSVRKSLEQRVALGDQRPVGNGCHGDPCCRNAGVAE